MTTTDIVPVEEVDLEVVIRIKYKANPAHYPGVAKDFIPQFDAQQIDQDASVLYALLDNNNYEVEVRRIEKPD